MKKYQSLACLFLFIFILLLTGVAHGTAGIAPKGSTGTSNRHILKKILVLQVPFNPIQSEEIGKDDK